MSFGHKEKENSLKEESDSSDEYLDSDPGDDDDDDGNESPSSCDENSNIEGNIEEDSDEDNDEIIENDEGFDGDTLNGNAEADEFSAENNKMKQNPGWADAMAKILKTNKPKRKKTIVLARAKKIKLGSKDDSDENAGTFEVDGELEEKPKIKIDSETNEKLGKKAIATLEMARRIRKKTLEAKGRVKPSVLDKDREKVLAKVATKGVVQLFNAVRQQQKSLEKEIKRVGPSNVKKDKVLKSVDKKAFLDVLMGAKSQVVPQVKDESKSNSEWSVLRDDFMMSKKLKDWDKEEDEIKDEFE